MGVSAYVRGLDPRLPRAIWTLEAGVLVNAAGSGMAMPFTAIYLHDVRGFALGTAGLVLAAFAAASFVATPLAGSLIDALGARRTLVAALAVSAAGYGLLPLVRAPWHAYAAMAIAGAGNGALWPAQASMLASLAGRELRSHAFAVQRGVFNVGVGLGALAAGLVAVSAEPRTFTILFLADAGTFVGYAVLLAALPWRPAVTAAAERRGRWLDVLRDRLFLALLGLNVVYVVAGYTLWEVALPVFAKSDVGVSETGIGLFFFANTVTIALLQLPVAKLLEGRSRLRALGAMAVVWAGAWMVVFIAGSLVEGVPPAALLTLAAIAFGAGECALGPAQSALVADIAPDGLRGRYLSLVTSSAAVGFVIGPAAVGFLLAAAPLAVWPVGALVLLAAGAGALALDERVPPDVRVAPLVRPTVEAHAPQAR